MRKTTKLIISILILINIFLASWPIFNKDIVFHTDIARDFSIMEEIVVTKKPTLIGPRAGGISGLFHGPLWFYINLPAFIFGKGNPLIVGYFWIFLSIVTLLLVFYSTKKLFDKKTAFFSCLLFSVFLIKYTSALFNSFGALIVFPLFFLFLRKYQEKNQFIDLVIALFFLGLTIQFQIGFGGIIFILTTVYLLFYLTKKKKIIHLSAYLILMIPLITFILFELRHDFFQIRSLITYLTTKQQAGELALVPWLLNRLKGIFFDGFSLFSQNSFLVLPITSILVWLFFKIFQNKSLKWRKNYWLYFYFYLGFWLMMFLYKGIVWGFFYWPFLPLTLIIISSLNNYLDKKFFLILFFYIFIMNFFSGIDYIKNSGYGWRLYHKVAQDIYRDANKKSFGYFVYSPDQYAYSGRYAMSYSQKEFLETKSFPYQKKTLVYLIQEPPPSDKPWLNSHWWKENQVKIRNKPVKIFRYPKGFFVEKFVLDSKEIEVPTDINLIQTTHFR